MTSVAFFPLKGLQRYSTMNFVVFWGFFKFSDKIFFFFLKSIFCFENQKVELYLKILKWISNLSHVLL